MRVIALFILAGLLGATSASGKPECTAKWLADGYSAKAGPGENTLFVPGQKESYDKFYERLGRDKCWKEWLILVYMAADHNLTPFSYRDIWEMEAAGSFPSTDVVVFHDSEGDEGIRYLHIARNPNQPDFPEFDSKEAEAEYLAEQGWKLSVSPTIKTLPEADSASVATLKTFLETAMKRYPSKRVLVMGWSHGHGIDGFALDTFPKTTKMVVPEMAAALGETAKKLRGGAPFEILGSDACLNQEIEVGYEWKGVAQYVFGSSTIVQKKGFNYRTFLKWFGEHPGHATDKLAGYIPTLYGGSVTSGAGKKYSSYYDTAATMATWTVDELLFLKRALDDLGKELSAWLDEPKGELEKIERVNEIRKLIGKTLRLGSISNDLFNLLQVLGEWASDKPDILDEVNSARATLQRAVIGKHIGKDYISGLLRTSLGVSIWLPVSKPEYREMFPKFKAGKFYKDELNPKALSPWAEFVEKLY